MDDLTTRKITTKIKDLRNSLRLKSFAKQNKKVLDAIKKVTEQQLSYLGIGALCDLAWAVIRIEEMRLEGIIIETGCALGGSAITIASAKSKERKFFVYDVFDIVPPPSERDGQDALDRYDVIVSGKAVGPGAKSYYGYEENLYDKVVQLFASFGLEISENNVHLVKGLYADTLKIESPVALAHIDCDWHDSVLTCLHKIEPHLVRNGILIIDDYYTWSGCKAAVDEYFQNKDMDNYKFIKKNRLHIIKR